MPEHNEDVERFLCAVAGVSTSEELDKALMMTDAQFLEKLLASERPCEKYATHYLFFFFSDTGKELYLVVRRDYSNSEFGEWVIEGTQIFD